MLEHGKTRMIQASEEPGTTSRDTASRRFVLTNDDGVDAAGLEALRVAAESLGRTTVVAPVAPQSGCSHRVTTHETLTIARISTGRFAVNGTPADCVRLALHHLDPGFSWVLSGINAGGNLGTDVFHSGTVAAAREAVIHGRPAIALSHYLARGRAVDWDQAARWTRAVLVELLGQPWRPGTFWNINLPHPLPGSPEPRIVYCPVDPSPLPLDYRVEGETARYSGDYQRRARQPSSDVDVCFNGQIAVSLVRMYCPESELLRSGLVAEGHQES
jgi:5'-nucleotidase